MIDQYERDINYLRVSVTDRCNLRCTYCMPKEGLSQIGHDDILRYEEILRIIRVATGEGITKVRITGGEPLVRRGVAEFIASLRTIPALNDISLTTNGILLEAHAEQLFAAGIRRINISLDSLNADKYARITRGGDIRAVLSGIRKVREAGFDPIKINIVAIKGFNDDEVLDFARLTLSNPYQIRFIELMPLGTAGDRKRRPVSRKQRHSGTDRNAGDARGGQRRTQQNRRAGADLPPGGRRGRNRLHQPGQPPFLPFLQPSAPDGGRPPPRLPAVGRRNGPQRPPPGGMRR